MSLPPRGTPRRVDLIVIGAGPAGASAALTAADRGLRVALVDKRVFPRDKLCGGGLTGRAIGHYRRVFRQDLPEIPLERRADISFHAFGEDLGQIEGAPPLHLGMRRALDHALVQIALARGVQDYTGQSGALDPETGQVTLPDATLSAPLIIAADGVNSPTARLLFGEAFDREKIGFALEIEHPRDAEDRPLRIDFGAAAWGYGWQFPKCGSVTIGLGGVLARNGDMKANLRAYLDLLGVKGAPAFKGQFLPFGDFRRVPGRGRILLAGDAAGLVDPITGEGIAHALHSGELAAIAVAEALGAGAPEGALNRYSTALRPIHQSLRHAGLLRNLMFRDSLRPTFIRSFRSSRSLRREYLDMLDGRTDYGPIMRKMAARLPGFAWRAMRGI